MKTIKSILVTFTAPMPNHMANGGEKLLGNASSIKKRNDGRVYISGQMQRHALFSAMDRLNQDDPHRGETYVANGDGTSSQVEKDLRADMGGFLHPSKNSYSGRRVAPLSATPAVAKDESNITRDLLIRIKTGEGESSREQALATREMSDEDMMLMNFFLDVSMLSTSARYRYENQFHVATEYVKHVPEMERKRRVRLFLEASRSLTDYANQARNAVSAEPQDVLIVFDTKMSRKAARYFEMTSEQQTKLLDELDKRGTKYFLGSDLAGDTSANEAYEAALAELEESNLYDLAGGDQDVLSFEETFSND